MINKKSAYQLIAVLLFVTGVILCAQVLYAQCEFGAFVGNEDHRAPYASEIQNFEGLAGKHIASNLMYWSWNDGDFPTAELNSGVRYHDGFNTQTTLHLVWEPWSRFGPEDESFTLQREGGSLA